MFDCGAYSPLRLTRSSFPHPRGKDEEFRKSSSVKSNDGDFSGHYGAYELSCLLSEGTRQEMIGKRQGVTFLWYNFFTDEFFSENMQHEFHGRLSVRSTLALSILSKSSAEERGSSSCMSALAPLTPHLPSSLPPPPKQKRIFLPRRMSERMEPSVRVLFKMKRERELLSC